MTELASSPSNDATTRGRNPFAGDEAPVTITQVTEAVSEIMRASSPGGVVDHAMAASIAGTIRPSVVKALNGKTGTGAELLSMPAFRTILSQHLSASGSAYADAEARKAMQHALNNANRSGSEYSALLGQLVGGINAMAHGRGDNRTNGDSGGGGARAASEAAGRASGSLTFTGDLGKVTADTFGGSAFAKAGLTSFSTFDSLRREHFRADNIIHAAEDATKHGLNANDKVVAKDFAILDQDDGKRREERNKLFTDYRERLHKDEEIQRLKQEYGKETDPDKRAEIAKKAQQRGAQIGKDSGLRGHIDSLPTPRAKKAGEDIQEKLIEKELKGNVPALAPGDLSAAKKNTSTIDSYARNPNDAAARRDYKPLIKGAAADPLTRGAATRVAKAVDDKIKLDLKVDEKNEVNAEQVTSTQSTKIKSQLAEDDLFTELTDKPSGAAKADVKGGKLGEKKTASVEPKKPDVVKSAKKTKVAGAPRPAT